jgi:hypothetical protein
LIEQGNLESPVDLLLQVLLRVFQGVNTGVVVASSDVLLDLPESCAPVWPATGVTGLAVPVDKALGPNHGVYKVAGDGGGAASPAAGECATLPVERFFQVGAGPLGEGGGQ